MYLKKEQPTFAGWHSRLPCSLSGQHLPIMTPNPVAWVRICVILWLDILIMGGILWLYQTQGLFMIYAPDTDVTKNSHDGCSWTVGHKKFFLNLYIYIYIYITLNLSSLESVVLLFYILLPELKTWTSFNFSCITSMFYICCLIFRQFYPIKCFRWLSGWIEGGNCPSIERSYESYRDLYS